MDARAPINRAPAIGLRPHCLVGHLRKERRLRSKPYRNPEWSPKGDWTSTSTAKLVPNVSLRPAFLWTTSVRPRGGSQWQGNLDSSYTAPRTSPWRECVCHPITETPALARSCQAHAGWQNPQGHILNGELATGSRPAGRPVLRYKDVCK